MEHLFFQGRRALVVGGTGGIGRAVAAGLAGQGALVTVTGGSSRERLDAALSDMGGSASGFLCRIGGNGGLPVEQAARFILEKAGTPDILVCAWGPFQKAALGDTDAEKWRFLTESNLIFPGILISLLLNGMLKQGWGRILLFGGTGTARVRGYTGTTAYSAAKTALAVLARSAAKAAAGFDITCNVICPGLTDTEYCTEAERAYNREHSPGAVLAPEDIAAAALEVLKSSGINGAVLPVDRGMYL